MGLRPTQANENGFHQFFCPFLTELSSRPERSAVEGPAVQRTSPENVFRQSEAQWRDLLFSGPLLRMFFDRAKRSGGTCCFSPSHSQLPLESPLAPCHPDRSEA